jgi:signal transduction histidine kinase
LILKLKKKLILYNLTATLFALFCVGFAVLKGIEGLSINTMEQQLIDQSRLAEIYISQFHILEGGASNEISADTAETVISKLGLVLGNVRIYDKSLNLQASSKENSEIDEGENKEILNESLNGGYAYAIKQNTTYFASPIISGGTLIGVFEIIYPMHALKNIMSGIIRILVIGTALFSTLVALLGSYFAGKVTKPINKLAAAAHNYADRNFTPVEINTSDEISYLSRSFNEMGQELQDYIQRQKQFVANVSHELRTPLTAIKGYSEFLMDEVEDRPDLKKAVHHLNNESARLEKLVDEVLTISRIDMDKEIFQFKRMDFSSLIKETTEKMMLRAEKYGIEIETDIESNLTIQGDSEKLIQVLVNLLDNAFKYSKSQSSVWIKARRLSDSTVLSIEDHGIGIPEEDKHKVFERFYRASNSRGISGTGLGLSIVKHIVEAHKGSIELASRTGGGTAVNIKLPVSK